MITGNNNDNLDILEIRRKRNLAMKTYRRKLKKKKLEKTNSTEAFLGCLRKFVENMDDSEPIEFYRFYDELTEYKKIRIDPYLRPPSL